MHSYRYASAILISSIRTSHNLVIACLDVLESKDQLNSTLT